MFSSDEFCESHPLGGPPGGCSGTVPPTAAGIGPAADFPQRVEDELPFLRQAVRRWHREKASADDLVQDTLLQALANGHLWQPGSNLRGWLLAIMRNQFLAAFAKSKRSAEMLKRIEESNPVNSSNPGEPRLLLRDVDRALQCLPKTQRIVVSAVAIEGKPQEDVAQMLGISVGAVRCHLVRGRERLRTAVRGHNHPLPFARRPAPATSRPRPQRSPLPTLEAAE